MAKAKKESKVGARKKQKKGRCSRLTPTEVVDRFLRKQVGCGTALSTNGSILWSYILPIGVWDMEYKGTRSTMGVVRLPPEVRWFTKTTVRHRGMLCDMATSRGILTILN